MPNVPQTNTYETINYNMFKYGFSSPFPGVDFNATSPVIISTDQALLTDSPFINFFRTSTASVNINLSFEVPVGTGYLIGNDSASSENLLITLDGSSIPLPPNEAVLLFFNGSQYWGIGGSLFRLVSF